ncbi:MAG TPA: hypothetical protein VFH83_00985, partial [Spirochaetia bacterium]|nr:hypothetical protein [Spirochaetia bacterium]
MRFPAVPRVAPLAAAALILSGAVVLGVLQVRWVEAATAAEVSRQRQEIGRGAFQVAAASADEERVLVSVSRISAADFAAGTWDSISSTLGLWYRYTRFPNLLNGAYILRSPRSRGGLAYARSQARFVDAVVPRDVVQAAGAALSAGQPQRGWETVTPGDGDGRRIVVLPVGGPTGDLGAVVLDLAEAVIYRHVVQYFMTQYLPDYPYRLVTADGTAIFSTASVKQGDPPEAVVGLEGLNGPGPGLSIGPQSSAAGTGASYVDPLLQSWLQRAQGNAPAFSEPPGRGERADVLLQVFYPNQSLSRAMRRQAAVNILVSLGILAFLVASMAVLSGLYRRSARL